MEAGVPASTRTRGAAAKTGREEAIAFFAHSIEGCPPEKWHLLREHLMTTAHAAENFALVFGGGQWAFLCGLLHDLGKYSLAFQERLRGGRRVDHSLAGALEGIRFLEQRSAGIFSNILAHVISGHHTGLADGVAGETGGASLSARLRARDAVLDYSAWEQEITLPRNVPPFPDFPRKSIEDLSFSLCFWTRMLYSCLVDADFLDTEAAMAPEKASRRGGYPALAVLHKAFDSFMAQKAAGAVPGNVSRQRATVLAACREAALWDQGLFSLTVPTGGGKTLSSLAFALKHAARYSLRRIIYVIPYTSIIEQTADVFREALGAELAHAVVEHHSGAEEKIAKTAEEADQREGVHTLAFDNWDAPLIVTTAVQFFESLFGARASRCRKLHNIAGSVIVLDEAQTLPTPLFRPCLAAIRELSEVYKASVMLCTATQPVVSTTSWNRNGLENVREIMPDPPALFRALDRVRTEHLGTLDMPTLAQHLCGQERALCIVNTRAQARDLCQLLRSIAPEGLTLFHLSTWMCPAHRRAVLGRIRAMLHDPDALPLLVVSTSLVEAGVDLDFPVVCRAIAGVDSIAQAAGRCNREGRLDKGHVCVFSLPDPSRGEMDRRRGATEAVLREGLPLLSPEAVKLYFEELHSTVGAEGLDAPGILRQMQENAARGLFPFRSVERDFRFIENRETPLLIPYNADAREALDVLRAGKADRSLYRSLQQWSVGVPERILALLGKSMETVGFASVHHVLANTDLYDGLEGQDADPRMPALGLDVRDPTFRTVEGLIL